MKTQQVTFTAPVEVIVKVDERAKEIDRSRSWLINDIVEAYVAKLPKGKK